MTWRTAPHIDSEIQHLKREIEQEQRLKMAIEHSTHEIQKNIEQLQVYAKKTEKEIENDDEDEWKVRYYTQMEVNHQLENQRDWLKERAETAKVYGQKERGLSNYLADLDLEKLSELQLVRYLRHLEKERHSIYADIRDAEWRLDQESKAFHALNETRKTYSTELTDAMLSLETLRARMSRLDAAITRSEPSLAARGRQPWTPSRGPGSLVLPALTGKRSTSKSPARSPSKSPTRSPTKSPARSVAGSDSGK